MKVSLIAAIGRQRQLGLAGDIPWRVPEDFKSFKRLTMDRHVLMGRKTFESLPGSLPGRKILVLSRTRSVPREGVRVVLSPREAVETAKERGESELFICGGAQVYMQCLKMAERFYLSRIDYSGRADTFFPPFENFSWRSQERTEHPAAGDVPAWTFEILEKDVT